MNVQHKNQTIQVFNVTTILVLMFHVLFSVFSILWLTT